MELVREFLRRNKLPIANAIVSFSWFVMTAAPASYLSLKVPYISLDTLLIWFLGGSAYMFGLEVLEQYVARKVG